MGISEQDLIGTAGGLSLTGKLPFASTFAVFETGRAWGADKADHRLFTAECKACCNPQAALLLPKTAHHIRP